MTASSNPQLILSSSSPARRALLERLKIPFIAISPDVDESRLLNESMDAMILRLAELKAKKAAEQFNNAYIIGCDQVGYLENKILTKPHTMENAIQQLNFMSGKEVIFKTAICLYDSSTQTLQSAIEVYQVHMRELTTAEIMHYLKHEDALECAGSCQVEGLGITLIKKLHGDDYTALIGLPLIRLTEMLKKAGFCI